MARNPSLDALAENGVVAMTAIPVAPTSTGDVPAFGAIDTQTDLLSWSRAYARTVVAATAVAVDLAHVDWEVSTRAKRRAAAVLHPRIEAGSAGAPLDWATCEHGNGGDPPRCTVRLTWDAARTFDRAEWARTLRHELVHVEQFQRTGATGHGPGFRDRAETLDTAVHCERFADPKYRLDCRDCGSVVARRYRDCKLVRRHEEYRSSCCGAPLRLHRTGARS